MFKVRNIFYLCIIFIFSIPIIYSQDIVVSEYYNDIGTSTANEWIELLVIKDNLDISGYYLRDNVANNGIPNSWQGGIIFNDIPLWKNLRAGTSIVIMTRGNVEFDSDPKDGFLKIGAENTTFFTKKAEPGNSLPSWTIFALSIAIDGELIQILDKFGNNVHTLGHAKDSQTNSQGDFPNIIGPKTCRFKQCLGGTSNRIVPGLILNDYNAMFDSGNSRTESSSKGITQGTANVDSNLININNSLWRKLREPDWNNPQATANFQNGLVKLTWNTQIDSFQNDLTQGYLIVKSNLKGDAIIPPSDGTIYKASDKLGGGIVVDVLVGSNTNNYLDIIPNECGETYIYNIYAFRYDNGGQTTWIPETGRGRSYNTLSFASLRITRQIPPNVIISTPNNQTVFCENDKSKIFSDLKLPNGYTYKWTKDDAIVQYSSDFGANDTLFLAIDPNTGSVIDATYQLEITNKDGCKIKSNQLNLTFLKKPVASIQNSEIIFSKDTLIRLCNQQSYQIITTTSSDKTWYKDGKIIANSVYNITINQAGVYYLVASNNNACFDTSYKITIKYQDFKYSVDQNQVNFLILGVKPDDKKILTFTNNTDDDIIFTKKNISFQPISTAFSILENEPYIIPAKGNKTLTLVFTNPQFAGRYFDTLVITDPCGTKSKVQLVGDKINGNRFYNLSRDSINFGLFSACQTDSANQIFTITNYSNDSINVDKKNILGLPFEIINYNLPLVIPPNDSRSISFKVTLPIGVNKFNSSLNLEVKSVKFDSNITINLIAETIQPDFQLEKNTLNFKKLLDCDISILDSILVKNTSNFNLSFIKNLNSTVFSITNLPLNLEAGKIGYFLIQFNPNSNSNFNENLNIEARECSINKPITISGSKDGISLSLSSNNVDFGILYNCNNDIFEKKIDFIAKTSGGQTLSIDSVEISGGFKSNLFNGMVLNPENEIKIILDSTKQQAYFGKLKFKILPCNIDTTISLFADIRIPIMPSDTTLFFDDIIEGNSVKLSSIFKNSNDSNLVISSLNLLKSNSKISISKIRQYPIVISNSKIDSIEFDYSSLNTSIDTAVYNIKFDKPCNKTINLTLIGKTLPDTSKNLNIKIIFDSKSIGKIGEIVKLPMIIENIGKLTFDESFIKNLSFSLNYNSKVLFPIDFIADNSLKSLNPIINSVESIPGTLNFVIQNNSITFPNGKIGDFEFKILLGDANKSSVIVTNPIISANYKAQIDLQNGCEVGIDYSCPLDSNLLITFDKSINLNILISQNEIKMKYNKITDDDYYLTIYDIFGNQIYNNLNISEESNLILDNYFASGVYFFKLSSIGISITKKLMIFK